MRLDLTLMAALLFLPALSLAANAPLAGKYSDGTLTLDLNESAGAYSGVITLAKQQFPATAKGEGANLTGSFTSGGNNFAFTAALNGDVLTLSTGGKTYTLKRSAPVNPLAAEPANPLAQPAGASADAPTGYTIEAATDSGKSLLIQKPNASSVEEALKATFPDLATYFGARPQIFSAYKDAKDPKSGGATFGADWKGHPVRGLISCKLHEGAGATVAVVFGRSDASKADWEKLTTPAPAKDSTDKSPAAPDTGTAKLRNYDFPDGTGSIGVAEGWNTKAQSAIHVVLISGPSDQLVIAGNSQLIQTPDSPSVQMMQHNQEMMRQMQERSEHMGLRSAPLPQPPVVLIAPLTDPVQALKNLLPQFSKRSEQNHGPSFTLDKIISSEDAPTSLPQAKAAKIIYSLTRVVDGKETHFRTYAYIQTSPITDTAWMWWANSLQAPEETFDRDLPVMTAMIKSLKINPERAKQVAEAENQQMQQMSAQMAQQSQQNLANNARQFQQDQDRRFAISQAQHQAQMQGYAQHNQQWQADQLQKSRSNADFIETIRGTRTVYDTQTGTAGTADLNYVNGVVDSLNQAALDPNRFVQIPLRDELYPAGK